MKKSILGILVVVILASVVFAYYSPSFYSESCLSLSFDDGVRSHYDIVYPALLGREIGGTFFIPSNLTVFEGRELMTKNEMKEIYDAGFEIGGHTFNHIALDNLSEDDLISELNGSKNDLESYGVKIYSLAFPYGKFNDKVLEISSRFYSAGRAIFNSEPQFYVYSFALQRDTSIEEVCDKVNYAKDNNLWLVLTLHDINDDPRQWETSFEDFDYLLDCVVESEIRTDSIIGCKNSLV